MEDKVEKEETIIQQKIAIDEYDLDLSLGLRSLNNSSCTRHQENVFFKSNGQIMSNVDKQELKRKAADSSAPQNGVVIGEEVGGLQRRRKVMNWWGNAEGIRVYEGHNGNFAGKNEGGGGDGENRCSFSSGSSSDISHSYHSNSNAGGHSSDTSSHSSHSRLHLPVVKQPISSLEETNLNFSDHNHNNNHNRNHCSTNVTSTDIKDEEHSPKEAKVVIGKPPKPKRQMSQQSVLLPQMPCVSATGNGPNGKTITGFLYKYSKTEVSIVCVCHGVSFSPAGFVEHAGGVDVEHPLRHIRVVPFAVT